MIALRDVWKSYDGGKTYAVKGVTLEVAKGETLVLSGSSGSGKTTVLKMINRLTEPTKGVIEIDGRNVMEFNPVELRRCIGYVFQGIGLFPHLTVAENVSIVLKLLGRPKSERRKRAEEFWLWSVWNRKFSPTVTQMNFPADSNSEWASPAL